MPSVRLRLLSIISTSISSIASINNGSSFLMMRECTSIGMISAVTPSTSAILVMFEPNALPTAMPGLPLVAANTATSISGAEVPKPTMVRPMISGDTCMLSATAAAPLMKRSALQISKTKPATIARQSINMKPLGRTGCREVKVT